MSFTRRGFITSTTASAAGLALPWSTAHAQTLPDNARIFAGFAPGGTVDVTARRLADKLRDVLAKNVQVENCTGAGGQIALSALKTATPDGLTLLVTPMSMLGIYPHTYKKLPGELFGRAANLDLKHVPYRGTQPAIVDLMGGQVASVSGPVGEFLQHLPTGKLRLIATSGPARNKFAPTVPTYAEQGFRDIVYVEWFGVFMLGKAAPDVLNKVSAAVRAALAALGLMGLESKGSTSTELAALLKKDTERWAPLVKSIGFTADS